MAILYPDGTGVPVSTQKKAAVQLLHHCAEDKQMYVSFERQKSQTYLSDESYYGNGWKAS